MHMYIGLRGVKDHVDRFVNNCMAQYFPFKYEKDKPMGSLGLAMRPLQLYEVVFPEEQLNEVLAIMQPYSLQGEDTKEMTIAKWIRRFLCLKKIPKVPAKPKFHNRFVSVIGIGLKKDVRDKDGIELL